MKTLRSVPDGHARWAPQCLASWAGKAAPEELAPSIVHGALQTR